MIYCFGEAIVPDDVMAIYSAQNPPMWWSPSKGRDVGFQVWTAFATGNWARELLALGEDGALQMGLTTLRAELSQPNLNPSAMKLVNWRDDPFAGGGYSAALPGGSHARGELAKPLADRLFFAGEATAANLHSATVHGAFMSGQRAAREVLALR
jgi:monoamine oxidase